MATEQPSDLPNQIDKVEMLRFLIHTGIAVSTCQNSLFHTHWSCVCMCMYGLHVCMRICMYGYIHVCRPM